MGNEIQKTLKFGSGIAFQINGIDVLFDDNRLISLTDLWKAAGSPANKEPRRWEVTDEGSGFIADLSRSLNSTRDAVWKSRRGKHLGGTWAHWQIAFAYAKYLSHEFHRLVNEAAREFIREAADPDLKAQRAIDGYRKRGKSDEWISARLLGKLDREKLTSILQAHGVRKNGVNDNGFAQCTNAINIPILGAPAKQVKEARSLKRSDPTRDLLTTVELRSIALAEALAKEQIQVERAYGNTPCEAVCYRAGRHVQHAVDSMRQCT